MKFKPSLLGYTRGSAGNVVVSSWKGKTYLRSKSTTFNTSSSPKQDEHRAKFALMLKTLGKVRDFINIGYKDYTQRLSAVNVALSENFKTAILGSYPDLFIDFTSLKLSMGNYRNLSGVELSSEQAATVKLSWDNDLDFTNTAADDKLLIWFFDPLQDDGILKIGVGKREDLAYETALPRNFSGSSVHVIVTIVSADLQKVSTSIYAGEILVS